MIHTTRASGVPPAPRLVRAAGGTAGAAPPLPRWLCALLRVPLTLKLVGANLVVAGAALAVLSWTAGRDAGRSVDGAVLVGALAIALIVNCALVHVALAPVRLLEETAARVWRGDLSARVPASAVADGDMRRLGRTVNLLLDSLADDRARLREVATQAIRAQDDERARIALELHDSTAQSVAALTYQLSAAARDSQDPALATTLGEIRLMAGDVLEEIRTLSHTIHPRVLDDLGLVPALEWLARTTQARGGPEVEVRASLDGAAPSGPGASTLYRVAQESLRNVERHSGARRAIVTLERAGDHVLLEVADDGRGFDLGEATARRPGMGLFSMRERVGLVDGTFEIVTAPGHGTRVRARIPLDSTLPPERESRP